MELRRSWASAAAELRKEKKFVDNFPMAPQMQNAAVCSLRPPKPLLLWDGSCAFCQRWQRRMQRVLGERLAFAPYQTMLEQLPEISADRLDAAIHLILPDGRVLHSAAAMLCAFGLRWPLGIGYWLYRHVPFCASLCEYGYRRIARRRHCLL